MPADTNGVLLSLQNLHQVIQVPDFDVGRDSGLIANPLPVQPCASQPAVFRAADIVLQGIPDVKNLIRRAATCEQGELKERMTSGGMNTTLAGWSTATN